MSVSILWSAALEATSDLTQFVQVSRVTQDIYEEAGLGGSADIFSGRYTRDDGEVTKVAIKCIRAFNIRKDTNSDMERLQKKLLRELEIWRTLSEGSNIIKLLGIINGIGLLPSFVCELCPWNLQDYLERKTPPPRHTKMMADTLRGLSYMHSMGSGPIAHGDIKLSNILVNSEETALICDFGRSRQPKDRSNEFILSSSSPFAGTVRYMSPELLVPESALPSPAADMWAYGCISLEMCDILEGLKYMHGYPVPISHGDLTPENISVDDRGRAKISLMSFGRMLAALPLDVGVTATAESVLSVRWMSPELVTTNYPQPTTESDMWTFGCVSCWLLTHREPYSSIKRDDLAGAEIMQGQPPAILIRSDYRAFWTTNGLWNIIAKCWRQDPLQRPTATEFMKLLTQLEGRNMDLDWLPVCVQDLAGKVRFDLSERQRHKQITNHHSVWRRFKDMKEEVQEEIEIRMALYEATYAPKWYLKATKVMVKAEYNFEGNGDAREALHSGMRHEVALMAQIDHPCIHKLLGIDSSPTHTYLPDMVFESLSRLTLQTLLSQYQAGYQERLTILRDIASAITYLHEHNAGSIAHGDIQPANIFVLSNGRAKLANFTCAFQYISGPPVSPRHLSGAISVPPQPSLYSSPESRDPLAFPSLAGDVWSFGTTILSSFSSRFRATKPDHHALQLERGILPVDSQEVGAECDAQILPLLRSMIVFEPANRPLMSSILTRLSNI
ncbi:unnamed protein product [Rhizoctonia solani]|uniref:Protein kinase domain-containing protein n=1 Tax=Rhizoctonia solani TaxID=456999 RepID=A0A8H3HSK5_9AGAM|nr:unnamed protein product [Rhizoctonia solani]